MAPRESRPRESRPRVKGGRGKVATTHHSPSSSSQTNKNHAREPTFRERAGRVLAAVRALKVKHRPVHAEFETRPDPSAYPLYYQLISEPVFLADIDVELRRGEIASCEALVDRFRLLVKNAKVFNKPGSTICKDAARLFNCFREAMLAELKHKVDEWEEDEDDLWAQDLVQRPRLALEERMAYREIMSQWDRSSSSHHSRRGKGEKHLKAFVSEPLEVIHASDRPSKKEISRSEFADESGRLRPASIRSATPCDVSNCAVCGGSEAIPLNRTAQKPAHPELVYIPQFRLIAPPLEGATRAGSSASKKRVHLSPDTMLEPRKLGPPILKRRLSESSSKRSYLGKQFLSSDEEEVEEDAGSSSSTKRVKRTSAKPSSPSTRVARAGVKAC